MLKHTMTDEESELQETAPSVLERGRQSGSTYVVG